MRAVTRTWARGVVLLFYGCALCGCAAPKPGQDRAPGDDAGGAGGDAIEARPVCQTPTPLPSGPAIFVIDSTDTLRAFDATGNPTGSVSLMNDAGGPPSIGSLNGGGITLASGNVYVTTGRPSVSVFDLALSPQAPDPGAFPGLSVPRGIAFDSHAGEFFVGNGGASVSVYDASGARAAADGGFPNHYGPSGMAYDPDDQTVWVANYAGFPASVYGVAEYSETGQASQTFAYSSQFVAPQNHQEPYSIAVCPEAAAGGSTVVVVGFIDDGSGLGTGSVQAYSTNGVPQGAPFAFAKPYALSCDSVGRVYVGDEAGLFSIDIRGGAACALPAGSFPGLQPPIYGTLATD
jgi:DNA-binding beta-propeller fold protein YncE